MLKTKRKRVAKGVSYNASLNNRKLDEFVEEKEEDKN